MIQLSEQRSGEWKVADVNHFDQTSIEEKNSRQQKKKRFVIQKEPLKYSFNTLRCSSIIFQDLEGPSKTLCCQKTRAYRVLKASLKFFIQKLNWTQSHLQYDLSVNR